MATMNIKNFPDPLYEELRDRAKREHRSISQEVVHLLETATKQPEIRSLLELRGLGKQIWRDVDTSKYISKERDTWDN
ncbi:MAG: hypothetical protein ACC707_04465 [Thiohalomonadales bacterium]